MPLIPAGHDKDQAFYSISEPEKRVERSVFTTGENTVQISLTTKFEERKLQKKINIKVLNLISSCKHPSKRPLSFFDERRRIDLSVVKNHFGFDCVFTFVVTRKSNCNIFILQKLKKSMNGLPVKRLFNHFFSRVFMKISRNN